MNRIAIYLLALGGVVIEYTSVQNLGWIGGLIVLLALVIASYSFALNKKNVIESIVD